MHTFRTEISIPPLPEKINREHKLLMTGSCFSDQMGARLMDRKIDCISNPLGNSYNPVSIAKHIVEYGWNNKLIKPVEIQEWQEIFSHADFHGSNNQLSAEKYIDFLNHKLSGFRRFLSDTHWLIITLGTSWVYTQKSSGFVVNNCHKIPNVNFDKKLLSTHEVLDTLSYCIDESRRVKPDIQFLFTVSPVRHLKDGMISNSRSKAILLDAVHHLTSKYERVYYFPAYEIMLDDLRDYRFYKEDMIHPNELAVKIIWDKFISTCFDHESLEYFMEIEKILIAYRHRPMLSGSNSYLSFCHNQINAIYKFQEKFGNIPFDKELQYYQSLPDPES
ncbi:MAG TPA: GSCFA domain-containing protein [Saprospiraceae bacterium]|nr:GSCFA domain-containing protein [Saprospiraceae bacterium]